MCGPFLPLVLVWTALIPWTACCSTHHLPDGLHVQCTDGRVTPFPDISDEDVVSLDLSHNQLSQLPHLPDPVLPHVRHLKVSFNVLTQLQPHSLRGLSQLVSLDASHNQIGVVDKDTFSSLSSLQTLLLHHNNLTQLTHNAFHGLHHLLTLRLDNNHLASLSANTLAGLDSLTYLDISYNALVTIANHTFSGLFGLKHLLMTHNDNLNQLEPAAFLGLNNLKEMKLDYNQLQLQHSSFPVGVFAPLHSVETFSLVHIDTFEFEDFPQGVFSDLVSVKDLAIDSSHEPHFGPDFASLSSIHTVDLSANCKINSLSNDSLSGFKNSSLQIFIASSCVLIHIERCAFCDLPHLKSLYLDHNSFLQPSVALLALYGLQGQSMSDIDMRYIGRYFPELYTIDEDNARYLVNICVKRFNIQRSHLQLWTTTSVPDTPTTPFTSCIEDMDASENRLAGDVGLLIRMLAHWQNLTRLSLQNQRFYSLELSACILSNTRECATRGHESPTSNSVNIPLHQTLTYLNMSSTSMFFSPPPKVIYFLSAQGLKTLGLSFGAMSHCLTTFVGLDNLETLDLSGNYCDYISDNLLDHLPSLRHLFLSNAHLQTKDLSTRAHRLFQNVGTLETLDLSRNWLVELQGRSLPAQAHLQKLLLSFNSFQILPVGLDLHPNLTVLDLSFNAITSLTSLEQQSLDTLASHHPVSLHLRGNPLVCACSSMDFLQWLWDTAVMLDGEGASHRRYTCTSETGEITHTERVMAEWQFLWRRCVGKQAFGWTLMAFFLQVLGLVLAYIVSRSWTHLKYAWHVFRRLQLPRRQDFRKDVYIAYADDDVELACVDIPRCLQPYGLRVLIRHREELPGTRKADNIAKFIDDSWKIVLLVTRAFAEDDWSCGFTVQQAQFSITDTLPNRVLVVFLEDPRHLPPMASLERLLRNYPEDNVFRIPRHTAPHHVLWDRLAMAILRP